MKPLLLLAFAGLAVISFVSKTPAQQPEKTCAWVAWREITLATAEPRPPTVEWQIQDALPTREACLDLRHRLWAAERKSHESSTKNPSVTVTDVPDVLVSVLFPNGAGYSTVRFLCLPDTVDPRRPR